MGLMRQQLLDELQEFYRPGNADERLSNLVTFLQSVLMKDTGCNEARATDMAEFFGGTAAVDRAQILLFQTLLPQLPDGSGLRRTYREVFLTMLQDRVDQYSHVACRAEQDLPDEDRCWPRLLDGEATDENVVDFERKIQTSMALLEMRLSTLEDPEQQRSESEISLEQLYKLQVYLWRVVLRLCPEDLFPDREKRWPLFFVPRFVEAIPASKLLDTVDKAIEEQRPDLVRTLLHIVSKLGKQIDFSQARLPSADQLEALGEVSGLGAELVESYYDDLSEARRGAIAMEQHQGEGHDKCKG